MICLHKYIIRMTFELAYWLRSAAVSSYFNDMMSTTCLMHEFDMGPVPTYCTFNQANSIEQREDIDGQQEKAFHHWERSKGSLATSMMQHGDIFIICFYVSCSRIQQVQCCFFNQDNQTSDSRFSFLSQPPSFIYFFCTASQPCLFSQGYHKVNTQVISCPHISHFFLPKMRHNYIRRRATISLLFHLSDVFEPAAPARPPARPLSGGML